MSTVIPFPVRQFAPRGNLTLLGAPPPRGTEEQATPWRHQPRGRGSVPPRETRWVPRPQERPAPARLDLARQVRHVLEDRGETRPLPILGGFVAEAHPSGRVRVSWRLPGPPIFGDRRRRRELRRYERLLRAWGVATALHFDTPEPYVACWVARRPA